MEGTRVSPPGSGCPGDQDTQRGPTFICQDYSPGGPPPLEGSCPSPAELLPSMAPPASVGDRKAERGSSSSVPGKEKREGQPLGMEAGLHPPQSRMHLSTCVFV